VGEKGDNKPKLGLIRSEHHSMISIGSVEIFVGPENMAPYPVDAVAAEEDTFLVLSADPEVFESHEDPDRVMAEVLQTRPEKPGTVVVKGEYPLQLLAIVHDLDRDTSWKEEWVVSALDGIFQEAENRKLKSIALPLLGTLHGSLEKKRFLVLLREALERKSPTHLMRLWLVAPEGTSLEILEMLKAGLKK
jgi:hypothetical protein